MRAKVFKTAALVFIVAAGAYVATLLALIIGEKLRFLSGTTTAERTDVMYVGGSIVLAITSWILRRSWKDHIASLDEQERLSAEKKAGATAKTPET